MAPKLTRSNNGSRHLPTNTGGINFKRNMRTLVKKATGAKAAKNEHISNMIQVKEHLRPRIIEENEENEENERVNGGKRKKTMRKKTRKTKKTRKSKKMFFGLF